MQIQPYLFFEGRCDEALAFYRSAVGAEVGMLMRYKESPDQSVVTAENADLVMHAALRIGESTILMSDGRGGDGPSFSGVSLSLSVKDDAEAERLFAALGDGGHVTMPMTTTFFASRFGMLADRFGLMWIVMAES